MKNFIPSLLSLLFMMGLTGCGVKWAPAKIHSEDPNRALEERVQEKTNQANAEAFILAHPELDEETKEGLRKGTITPASILDREKTAPSPK
jgi:predicted small lipoprotein YifL